MLEAKAGRGQRRRSDEKSSRRNSRLTLVRCHLPPRAVDISRLFNSRAMALMETKPALRSLRIVGPKARTSATRLLASPLLILPLPDVIRPKRASILTTAVRCKIPPRAAGIPLWFSAFTSALWDTKPAAISFRMVEANARARVSAACLLSEAPCPRRLDEVFPRTFSIRTLWPDFNVIS